MSIRDVKRNLAGLLSAVVVTGCATTGAYNPIAELPPEQQAQVVNNIKDNETRRIFGQAFMTHAAQIFASTDPADADEKKRVAGRILYALSTSDDQEASALYIKSAGIEVIDLVESLDGEGLTLEDFNASSKLLIALEGPVEDIKQSIANDNYGLQSNIYKFVDRLVEDTETLDEAKKAVKIVQLINPDLPDILAEFENLRGFSFDQYYQDQKEGVMRIGASYTGQFDGNRYVFEPNMPQ